MTLLVARALRPNPHENEEDDHELFAGAVGASAFPDTCLDCKRVANAPACGFFCNLNAINVPHQDLARLNGLYKVRHDSTPDIIRWVLGLEFDTNGSIRGFSTVRRGPRYQDYDVSGVYIGDDTLLLLLSSETTTEEGETRVRNNDAAAESEYLLAESADPDAVGLKLQVLGQGNLLTGSTTGYTYLDPESAIVLTFERTDTIDSTYFQDG
jgi:hypothetical protein